MSAQLFAAVELERRRVTELRGVLGELHRVSQGCLVVVGPIRRPGVVRAYHVSRHGLAGPTRARDACVLLLGAHQRVEEA